MTVEREIAMLICRILDVESGYPLMKWEQHSEQHKEVMYTIARAVMGRFIGGRDE